MALSKWPAAVQKKTVQAIRQRSFKISPIRYVVRSFHPKTYLYPR
jgi:hypothetical protein